MAQNLQAIVDDLEDCLSEVASLLEQAVESKNWAFVEQALGAIQEMTEAEPETP